MPPAASDLEESFDDTIGGTEGASLSWTEKLICTITAGVGVDDGQVKLKANVGVCDSRLEKIRQRASDDETVVASGTC